ncbi:MAG: RidA family protein [Tateyamaria sp.]|jgi:enamine deaminase RidA (YjgF/YER057c/UK114 family)|nr:RidA family protein [Tateyamaria sp.]MBT6266802.1 RidA family protein [Tateyamaria sp.]MBT6342019.1 RidA family protein [Tateyamaria sp.]
MSDPIYHIISGGPSPVAPFSQAVESNEWFFLMGQMPTDPKLPDAPLPIGIVAPTSRVMENLVIVLAGVHSEIGHVDQCRCYLTEFERDYADVNKTYQRYFKVDFLPAHITVAVMAPVIGALIEIDRIARRLI